MFKWLKKWFDSEFPPIIDDPRPQPETQVIVTEPVTTPSILKDTDLEKYLNLSKYKQKGVLELRIFFELLNSKELIGVHNAMYNQDKNHSNTYDDIVNIYDYIIFSKDGFKFEFNVYDSINSNDIRLMSFRAYEVIPAAAQGHLFDDPTILRKSEYTKHAGYYLAYDKFNYYNPEQHKYLKAVTDKSIAHVLKLIEGLPAMDPTTVEIPVFNKLWEQMDLPLDTGTEIVKL